MCADPVGARILAERPSVRSDQIDVAYLRALPHDSFGYAYSQFMDAHGCVCSWSDSVALETRRLTHTRLCEQQV